MTKNCSPWPPWPSSLPCPCLFSPYYISTPPGDFPNVLMKNSVQFLSDNRGGVNRGGLEWFTVEYFTSLPNSPKKHFFRDFLYFYEQCAEVCKNGDKIKELSFTLFQIKQIMLHLPRRASGIHPFHKIENSQIKV